MMKWMNGKGCEERGLRRVDLPIRAEEFPWTDRQSMLSWPTIIFSCSLSYDLTLTDSKGRQIELE